MVKKTKCLVTGGAGFIGSHIAERLLSQGNFVRILDNFSSGKEKNISFSKNLPKGSFELIKGDIQDSDTCFKATRGMEYVFHQAALRSVPKSMENPHEYDKVNIGGTLTMLESALKNKVRSFVFASSSSIYGDTQNFPESEKEYPLLISPYALTKLTGEFYCQIFAKNYGLNTVALRYFNVFGPRQALDDEYAVVIPKFITSLLKDQSPPVYGTGKQSRDFTFVGNVVDANLLAASRKGISGCVFNVALGKDYSILDLLENLNKILKKQVKPLFLPPRKGDVFRTLADLSKAKKLLGYQPKMGFSGALEITTEWFKKNYSS